MVTIGVLWYYKTVTDGKNLPAYRKVILSDERHKTIFKSETGDVVKDWFRVMNHYVNHYSNRDELSYDSSLDHFLSSSEMFRKVYLVEDIAGEIVLVTPSIFMDTEYEDVIVYIIPQEMGMTWDSLKLYVR
jgi:hypothetical protein